MGHKHSVFDTDTHFIINPLTRAIKNTSTAKTTVIQHDHNSERFSFELSRLVEGHDMMQCDQITVHYINIDGTTKEQSADIYEVDDIQVSPDNSETVVFSWLLSRNATKYAGTLNFIVRFVCLDDDGSESYAWHTAIFKDITVSSGILNDAAAIIEPYADVLAKWKADLFGAGAESVGMVDAARDRALSAIAEAGENITGAVDIAKADMSKLFANAIKGNISGEIVTANDVSSVPHEMSVNVRGKNLCPISELIVSGAHPWANKFIDETITLKRGKHTISAEYTQNGAQSWVCVSVRDSVNTTAQIAAKSSQTASGKLSLTFEITDDERAVKVVFYSNLTADILTTECVFANIQLEEGTTATEYTPYVAPESVALANCGKNIMGFKESFSINQIGLDVSYDIETGIFTINGTPTTASTSINFGTHLFDTLSIPIGTDVALSIEHIGGTLTAESTTNVFYLGCSDIPGGGRNNWFSVPFPVNGRKTNITTAQRKYFSRTWVYIGGEYNVTFTDYKFRVQLEIGTAATEYEKFRGVKYTPEADGSVKGVFSVSPDMTILTNRAGTKIDCQYTVDTETYIKNKIAEMIGGENG